MKKAPNFCPKCKKEVTNGVGPSDLPSVTKFLHMLPSSHIFHEAANWHDILYHFGKTESDRKKADKIFLKLMLHNVSIGCASLDKIWYKLQAYRNYYCVRWFGSKFFNYQGCK